MRWTSFHNEAKNIEEYARYTSPSVPQRRFYRLELLTFISKHSFWGVRGTVIVSTADSANDTPLLCVTQTELTPNSCNCDRQPIKSIAACGPAPSGPLVFLTRNLPSACLITHSDRRTGYKTSSTAVFGYEDVPTRIESLRLIVPLLFFKIFRYFKALSLSI